MASGRQNFLQSNNEGTRGQPLVPSFTLCRILPVQRGILRNRHRNTVGRNNLSLVGEDFPALGIDENLEPVHVVRSVGLVIAKGFYTGKILKPSAKRILHWPVDPEVMRVAMNVGDRFAKGNHLVA